MNEINKALLDHEQALDELAWVEKEIRRQRFYLGVATIGAVIAFLFATRLPLVVIPALALTGLVMYLVIDPQTGQQDLQEARTKVNHTERKYNEAVNDLMEGN